MITEAKMSLKQKEPGYMSSAINRLTFRQKMQGYKNNPFSALLMLLLILAAAITILVLFFIVLYILIKGVPHLKPSLFSLEYTSENKSMMPSIINTLVITFLSLLIAAPIGISAAVYLTEYSKKGNKAVKVIRLTTETLSGIPSIVYGLFGMLCFVNTFKLGYSLLSGGLTLAIMVLPLIIKTTEEALLSVPDSYREGSFGLGAGKFRTIMKVVLPSAVPGILSGIILATGRIVGETAALMYTAGSVSKIAGLFDTGETLAVHMYVLSNEGLYVNEAYATAVVLMVVVILINMLSSAIAKKLTKG